MIVLLALLHSPVPLGRYFASDPMVYERLGYKRMRDFLGAVPQVHKQGTKAESKYV